MIGKMISLMCMGPSLKLGQRHTIARWMRVGAMPMNIPMGTMKYGPEGEYKYFASAHVTASVFAP